MNQPPAHEKGGEQTVDPCVESCLVISNTAIAPSVHQLVLRAPGVAGDVLPGQFVHVRVTAGTDVLLRRPFSVHRVIGEDLVILYRVVGRGTRMLSDITAGRRLDVIGPLGNGWRVPAEARRALLVAGGLGVAPMGMLAERLNRKGVATTLALGALTREGLLAVTWSQSVCDRVDIVTDDGSAGRRGLVTDLLDDLIKQERPDAVFTCGPEVMQRAAAAKVSAEGIPCQVSLERRMACGIGACLSCVVKTRDGLARVCVDGPVFDAREVFPDLPSPREEVS